MEKSCQKATYKIICKYFSYIFELNIRIAMKNSYTYLLFLILISNQCFSQGFDSDIQQTVINNGVGLGSVIAVVLSLSYDFDRKALRRSADLAQTSRDIAAQSRKRNQKQPT